MSTLEPVKEAGPKRRRNGMETRRQLLCATKALIGSNDFHSITLDQVSAAVGVSKSSILWHFGSKEDLLTAAIFDLFDDMEKAITPQITKFPSVEEKVVYLLEAVADYFTNNPEAKGIVLSLIMNSQTPSSIRERIVVHVREDKRKIAEFLSSGTDTVSLATAEAIVALIHGCYIQWYLDGCPDDFGEKLVRMYAALSAGCV